MEMVVSEPNQSTRMSKRHRTSLTEQAYAILRERVILGDLPPGAEISEPELAEQLQMSKTPVREALGRLCLEGFMEAFPRRGYRITPITLQDMNNLFVVRGALEGTAAALAAVNLTEEELDELDRLADTNYISGENVGTKVFIARNEQLHGIIAQGSRNPRLTGLVTSHLEECARLFHMGMRLRDINPETDRDHQRIVGYLRKRDPVMARQAMMDHNEHTRKGLLDALIANATPGVTL